MSSCHRLGRILNQIRDRTRVTLLAVNVCRCWMTFRVLYIDSSSGRTQVALRFECTGALTKSSPWQLPRQYSDPWTCPEDFQTEREETKINKQAIP